jgi:hypothetical protein
MWTLILGGWVLNSPTEEVEKPAAQQPFEATVPASPSDGAMRGYPAGGTMPRMPMDSSRDRTTTQRGSERSYQGEERPRGSRMLDQKSTGGGQTARQSTGTGAPNIIPNSPTDMSAPMDGQSGQLLPPTANDAESSPSGMMGRSSGGMGGMRTPMAPTYRRPATGSQSGYRPTSRGSLLQPNQQVRRPVGIGGSMLAAPQAAMEKPFGAYRPTSSVSPYMNLFRHDTSGGTIDNYSTFVRPQLEQRNVNQQVGRDLRGLERNTRVQSTALQQMERESRGLQGVTTPQFMNYGNFFPSGSGEYGP